MKVLFDQYGHKYETPEGERTKTDQAHADDLLVFGNSKENMDILMDDIVTYTEYTHIAINPDKCKILVSNRNESVDTDFTLSDGNRQLNAVKELK
jgi:hypothetical protein